MNIETLTRFKTADGRVRVRLVRRDTATPFAVVVDAVDHYASFVPLAEHAAALAHFAKMVASIQGATQLQTAGGQP